MFVQSVDVITSQNEESHQKVMKRFQDGGILIIGYETLLQLCFTEPRMYNSQLINPGPDIVFFDEGHRLKNEQSKLYFCLNTIKTKRRVILSGSTFQNNLMECKNLYYCFVL